MTLSHLVWLLLANVVHSQNLTSGLLSQVEGRLADGAKFSWELGTRAQALTNFHAGQYSVFFLPNDPNLPPPANVSSSLAPSLGTIFQIARTVVNSRPNSTGGPGDAQPLFANDSSAGDPASMGVAVILANLTNAGGADFKGAATQQLNFLLNDVPKSDKGAISHRKDQVQLWSDSVYMVPPFLAYYGMTTQNQSMLREAFNQVQQYRAVLVDTNNTNSSFHGLWHHVLLGDGGIDEGHWSTGNAWAAQGMLRVYATIRNSQYSNALKPLRNSLGNWVSEIHNAIYPLIDPSTSLFHNYASDPTSFLDASSTALLAASVYRLSLLTNQNHHIPDAEKSRKALSARANGNETNFVHFDENGWLTPVVDPHNVGQAGSQSPEGQAFVLEMESAYQDWLSAGSPGVNGAKKPCTKSLTQILCFVTAAWVALLTAS